MYRYYSKFCYIFQNGLKRHRLAQWALTIRPLVADSHYAGSTIFDAFLMCRALNGPIPLVTLTITVF